MISMYNTTKIVQKWANEVKKPVGIKVSKVFNELQLYTKFPGMFIGYHGELINKYKQSLREIGWDNVMVIELQDVLKPRGVKNDPDKSCV